MEQDKVLGGCLCRRQCWVPTLRGWGVLVVGFVAVVIIGGRGIAGFLAVNAPAPGSVLVVEGWAPDYAMQAAVDEFKRNHYQKVLVTGIPIEHGAPLSEYGNHANLGAAVLVKLGLSTNVVQAVPNAGVQKDRTYAMAATLKHWMVEHGMPPTNINLVTMGPHARRSRLMFEKAFGNDATVGVIALAPEDYDLAHWWRSSMGVRTVIGEMLGYGYARLLFVPPKQ
jgi:hypothetical protein